MVVGCAFQQVIVLKPFTAAVDSPVATSQPGLAVALSIQYVIPGLENVAVMYPRVEQGIIITPLPIITTPIKTIRTMGMMSH